MRLINRNYNNVLTVQFITCVNLYVALPCKLVGAEYAGACPGFLKGGGPISLGSLKKGHQILKGGSSTFVSLGRQILHI